MSILDQIVEQKKRSIEQLDVGDPYAHDSADQRIPLDFIGAIKKVAFAVIAEIKKASPSKGIIRNEFDPLRIAEIYQNNSADCISVLTEEAFFQGDLAYLKLIKEHIKIPLLRKDFIIDVRQIKESYLNGADAILLIAALLDDDQLIEFKKIADLFSLHCLVEIHTLEEARRINQFNFPLIGINNRNLKTFSTDINNTIILKESIVGEPVIISESGIEDYETCLFLQQQGIQGALIGEYFMRQNDIGASLKKIKQHLL